jgi:hypothetical protein
MNPFTNHRDASPDRPMQVFNVRYLPGRRNRAGIDESPRDTAGSVLLAATSVLLLALAIAQGYVSYRAQYSFVHAIKHERPASILESLGLDCAAVIFALLAIAQARLGRPAVAERVLNLACVSGSLVMNALSADVTSPKSVAVWVLPAALYAATSDRLIAVVRRRALAAQQGDDGDESGSPLAALLGFGLWLLRLVMAPPSTVTGFRGWVLDEAPVAPGRRALPAGTTDRPALTPAADTPPDERPDTAADGNADTPRSPERTRRPATTGRSRRRKAGRPADREADALELLTANPGMNGAELGRALRVSERTGRRYHERLTARTALDPADVAALTEGDAS